MFVPGCNEKSIANQRCMHTPNDNAAAPMRKVTLGDFLGRCCAISISCGKDIIVFAGMIIIIIIIINGWPFPRAFSSFSTVVIRSLRGRINTFDPARRKLVLINHGFG